MTTRITRLTREELMQTDRYQRFVEVMVKNFGDGARECIRDTVNELYGNSSIIIVSDGFYGLLEGGVRERLNR